jgi:hypothetical protein
VVDWGSLGWGVVSMAASDLNRSDKSFEEVLALEGIGAPPES